MKKTQKLLQLQPVIAKALVAASLATDFPQAKVAEFALLRYLREHHERDLADALTEEEFARFMELSEKVV